MDPSWRYNLSHSIWIIWCFHCCMLKYEQLWTYVHLICYDHGRLLLDLLYDLHVDRLVNRKWASQLVFGRAIHGLEVGLRVGLGSLLTYELRDVHRIHFKELPPELSWIFMSGLIVFEGGWSLARFCWTLLGFQHHNEPQLLLMNLF